MNRIPRFTRLVAALGLGLSLATTLLASRPAQAEGEIRIAEQFGIVYLLLNVVRDQRLIEKHGQAEGLQIKVDWTQLSGGAAVNDALLSGAIDIAGAGVGPLLTIWDRTRGRQNVKAVASLGNFPYYLLSNDPRVRSIADFGAGDRIAVPAVGVSVQSRFLQYVRHGEVPPGQPEDLPGLRRGAEGSGGLRPERQGGRRRYLYPGDRGEDRPSRAAEDHRQSAGGVQRHAEEHLSAGGVSLPGRCDPQQAGLLAGLFLPGRRAVAGELRRR